MFFTMVVTLKLYWRFWGKITFLDARAPLSTNVGHEERYLPIRQKFSFWLSFQKLSEFLAPMSFDDEETFKFLFLLG